jgi:excisionase family DNA binding protein
MSNGHEAERTETTLPDWPGIMDLDTAARYMSRSYDVVWSMIKAREIPAVVHGRRKFLRKQDIDAWAQRNLV